MNSFNIHGVISGDRFKDYQLPASAIESASRSDLETLDENIYRTELALIWLVEAATRNNLLDEHDESSLTMSIFTDNPFIDQITYGDSIDPLVDKAKKIHRTNSYFITKECFTTYLDINYTRISIGHTPAIILNLSHVYASIRMRVPHQWFSDAGIQCNVLQENSGIEVSDTRICVKPKEKHLAVTPQIALDGHYDFLNEQIKGMEENRLTHLGGLIQSVGGLNRELQCFVRRLDNFAKTMLLLFPDPEADFIPSQIGFAEVDGDTPIATRFLSATQRAYLFLNQ